MIRPTVKTLAALPNGFEKAPLRAIIDWYKTVVTTPDILPLSDVEDQMVSESWVAWVKAIAAREGVPVGWLSYCVNLLVEQELGQ
jgi:hypothetical protein